MKKYILIILILTFFQSCTSNQRAKSFGGKQKIELKPNEKLLTITWKEDDMWMLTIDTISSIKYFRESSSFGIWNGEISIK
jgi:hypothetical protein